jgi:Flp pilus assembly protein TadD
MMKRAAFVFCCFLLGGCAQVGFEPVPSTAPRASDVGTLDAAAKSRLYLEVVNGLLEQGRYRAALAYLDQYAVAEKKTPFFQQLYGEALLGTEQYEEAAEAFSALTRGPLAPEGYSGLGRVSGAQGDWAAAVSHFRKAVAVRPSSAEFLNNLGYAQLCLGGDSIREAEFNLRQAQELDPASISIRNNLVIALLLAGKEGEARRLLAGIPAAHERAEVQQFAMDWVKRYGPAAPLPHEKEEM